ncbi:MAG: T9SS type A sorting domain-containing protein [Calditrichaeota bacterium]|nr:T9SS type A sorting domain-containing protein [Calditrichota bacterium]
MAKFFKLAFFFSLLIFVSSSFSQTKTFINSLQGTSQPPKVALSHSSTANIEFHITIPYYQKSEESIDARSFDLLKIENFNGKNDVGQPDVPLMGKMILLPNDSPISVSIHGEKYIELDNVFIAPVAPPAPENKKPLRAWIDNSIYQKAAFFPKQLAWTEPVKIMRGYRMTTLWISPLQFNPVKKKARIYYDFQVSVNFENSQPINYSGRLKSAVFANLLKKTVSNWELSQKFARTENTIESQYDFFTGCDYLIITHPRFAVAAHLLAEWERMRGLNSKVVDVQEIGDDAQSIRNFIQYAYEHWNPAPTYVVFLGDAEFIPTNYYTKHSSEDNGTIGTDLYYTTVDGSDYFPDIISGRIPVDEPIEANSFVERLIQYEKNPVADPSFYQNIVVASYFQDDDDTDTPNYNERDGYEDRRFVLTSEEMRDFLLNQGYQVERVYTAKPAVDPQFYNNGSYASGERLPQELLRSKGFTWDGDARDISNAIERGCFLVSHRDHGSRNGWGDPSYQIGDVKSLANGDKLPVVMSINCATGWYDNETDDDATGTSAAAECFVEAWIRNLHGGAVAVFGATRVSYSGYNDALAKGILDAIWPRFLPDDPAEISTASLGEALNYGKLVMASQYSANKTRLVEFEEFHFYGDPAMQIWTQFPQELQVSHSDTLRLNQTSLSVAVNVPEAVVSLVQGTQLLATERTNQSGEANLHFSPISADSSVTLVVRKQNYKPYIADLAVIALPSGAIILSSVEMEDENDDHEINIGEEVRWSFLFENKSQSPAENIELSLVTEDSFIVLKKANCTIPWIDAGERAAIDSLIFVVGANCPDGHFVSMNLRIVNSSDTLNYPLDFKVRAGVAEISVSPILLAENMQPGDSLYTELFIQNDGFGAGKFSVKDDSRKYVAIGDTVKKLWLATKEGCGNVFYMKEDENLLGFNFFMKVDSATDVSYFIYQGDHLTGNYVLKWHKLDHVEEIGVNYYGTGLVNLALMKNKYYYFGVSWTNDETKICRSDKYPPVVFPFGTLTTGTVNAGGMSPTDTIKQSYGRIFTFVQQVDFGTTDWLEIPVQEKTLLPKENFNFPVTIKAPLSDTLLQTNLIVAAESSTKDSLIIPVAITTSGDAEIALNVAGVRDDGNQDGEINPGETAALSVLIKNLGSQPLAGVTLTVAADDTVVGILDENVTIDQLDAGEQKLVDAFVIRVSPFALPEHTISLLINAEYDNGKTKQLIFPLTVKAGQPVVDVFPDTIVAVADTFLQMIDEKITISNNGYGAFPFKIINPIQQEYSIGIPSDQPALAISNGCGNVYFFVKSTILQSVEMDFQVTSGGRIYFFVYESESDRGDFSRIYYSSIDVAETGNVWVASKRINLALKKNHFYYIGACWQGEMKIVRLQQAAPVAFQTFQVAAGSFAASGFPPQELISINNTTPMLLAQKIVLGQGTWMKTGNATDVLYPGESIELPVQFFANESDTVLTSEIFIKSLDADFSNKTVPVKFHINAVATSVDEHFSEKIKDFALGQNFPNPFNPTTTISFQLPRSSFVEIKIYNTLGQQISSLISRKFTVGAYKIQWDGKNSNGIGVASGIYIVKFKAQTTTISRKIILLR